jgi:hypothetical protein
MVAVRAPYIERPFWIEVARRLHITASQCGVALPFVRQADGFVLRVSEVHQEPAVRAPEDGVTRLAPVREETDDAGVSCRLQLLGPRARVPAVGAPEDVVRPGHDRVLAVEDLVREDAVSETMVSVKRP